MDSVGMVGAGVVGGLEDLEISADMREAKSMVCGNCGLLSGCVWRAVVFLDLVKVLSEKV